MEKPEWVTQLEAEPCKCVFCDECKWSGHVWFSIGGWAHGKYLGSSRSDDLDEMETCDVWGGGGITETCERCQMLNDYDEDTMCA